MHSLPIICLYGFEMAENLDISRKIRLFLFARTMHACTQSTAFLRVCLAFFFSFVLSRKNARSNTLNALRFRFPWAQKKRRSRRSARLP